MKRRSHLTREFGEGQESFRSQAAHNHNREGCPPVSVVREDLKSTTVKHFLRLACAVPRIIYNSKHFGFGGVGLFSVWQAQA